MIPTADHDGFTDSAGRRMSMENGIRSAARCIIDQREIDVIESMIRGAMSPDDMLAWIVYPDTGEFADASFIDKTT